MSTLAVSLPFDEMLFRDGLERGVVYAAPALVLGGLWWWRFRRPAPVAGLVLAFAAVMTLEESFDVSRDLRVGVAILAAGGLVGDLLRRWWPVALLPATVGASMIANDEGLVDTDWIRTLVAVTTVAGGALMAAFDRRWGSKGYGPPLLLISVVGVYFTVPDTEHALVLLGAAIPAAALAWPLVGARLGVGGSFAAAGVLAWVIAADGFGRETSIVGGAACLGLLAAEPVGRAVARGRSVLAGRRSVLLVPLALVHLGVVYAASRVAGLRPELREAVTLAVADLAIACLLVAATGLAYGRRKGRVRSPVEAS